MHCIPFLLCSLFLTVTASFYDGHRIPADLFLPFLPIFCHGSAENCISCSLDTHRLTSTNEPGPLLNLGSLLWQEAKNKIWEFHIFSKTQEGKVRPSSLHKKGHKILYNYLCTESNSLSAKTSRKITFIPSLFTCSTKKKINFWIYDLLSMTVTHATTPLSCLWHSIWSMNLASLAAARHPQVS